MNKEERMSRKLKPIIYGLIKLSPQCDKCNGLLVGALKDDVLGCLYPCSKKNCPIEEKTMQWGETKDNIVFLRKLK